MKRGNVLFDGGNQVFVHRFGNVFAAHRLVERRFIAARGRVEIISFHAPRVGRRKRVDKRFVSLVKPRESAFSHSRVLRIETSRILTLRKLYALAVLVFYLWKVEIDIVDFAEDFAERTHRGRSFGKNFFLFFAENMRLFAANFLEKFAEVRKFGVGYKPIQPLVRKRTQLRRDESAFRLVFRHNAVHAVAHIDVLFDGSVLVAAHVAVNVQSLGFEIELVALFKTPDKLVAVCEFARKRRNASRALSERCKSRFPLAVRGENVLETPFVFGFYVFPVQFSTLRFYIRFRKKSYFPPPEANFAKLSCSFRYRRCSRPSRAPRPRGRAYNPT